MSPRRTAARRSSSPGRAAARAAPSARAVDTASLLHFASLEAQLRTHHPSREQICNAGTARVRVSLVVRMRPSKRALRSSTCPGLVLCRCSDVARSQKSRRRPASSRPWRAPLSAISPRRLKSMRFVPIAARDSSSGTIISTLPPCDCDRARASSSMRFFARSASAGKAAARSMPPVTLTTITRS